MKTLLLITTKTPQQLDALALHSYILSAVAGVAFLLLALLITYAIKFEGGAHPRDPRKRRMVFWILLLATFAGCYLYNMLLTAPAVAQNLQNRFLKINLIGSSIAMVTYLVLGFALSRMFRNGKPGNWFSSGK